MSRGLGENEILPGEVLTDVFSFTYIGLFSYLPLACHLTAQYVLLCHRSTNTNKAA